MVDLYNRKAKLEYWIQRVNTDFSGTDKSDLLKLVEHMQDKERTILKKITQYGALVALGILLTAHFIPNLQEFQSSYISGIMVTSVLSLFGAGRVK
jgi:hypothetical protein